MHAISSIGRADDSVRGLLCRHSMQAILEDATTHEQLTPRERDIVHGIAAGNTNREIASELGLSEQSVKNVLSTVYLKCCVRNRLELMLYAVRHRLGDEAMNPGGQKSKDEDVRHFLTRGVSPIRTSRVLR